MTFLKKNTESDTIDFYCNLFSRITVGIYYFITN